MAATMVIINVPAFLVQLTADYLRPGWVDQFFALSREGVAAGYFWQPVTYMLLHGSLFHLLANSLVIYFAGRQVEQILGSRVFLQLYLAGAIFGGLLQLIGSGGYIIGASAAGFALLIAFTTILPELEITLLLFFIIPVRMKAKYLAYGAVASTLIFALFDMFPGYGHLAHLGGALVGYVFTRWLGYGIPLPIERMLANKQEEQARRERMSAKEYISEEIDPILDKIARHGMHSLTRQERRVLEHGREKIERRTSVH